METTQQSTLPPEWAPRHYREGDEKGALQVLQAAFDGWPKVDTGVPASEHLRWKMASHPEASRLNIVGEVDDRIIAWQCYWLRRVRLDGEVVLGKQGVDFCVHPDFQRLGIRGSFWRFAVETPRRNFRLNFDLVSGHPAMRRVQERLERPGRRYLANRIQALAWRGDEAPSPTTSRAPDRPWVIRETAAFDDRFDAFWGEASEPFRLIAVRDRAFLNWRYADARAGRFTMMMAEQAGDILGYVVVCLRQRGRGCIADVLALPDRIDVAASLVREAVTHLASEGVAKIECWLPTHHPYQPIFTGQGFRPRRRAVRFFAGPAWEYVSAFDISLATDPDAAIHITMGDSDLV